MESKGQVSRDLIHPKRLVSLRGCWPQHDNSGISRLVKYSKSPKIEYQHGGNGVIAKDFPLTLFCYGAWCTLSQSNIEHRWRSNDKEIFFFQPAGAWFKGGYGLFYPRMGGILFHTTNHDSVEHG